MRNVHGPCTHCPSFFFSPQAPQFGVGFRDCSKAGEKQISPLGARGGLPSRAGAAGDMLMEPGRCGPTSHNAPI